VGNPTSTCPEEFDPKAEPFGPMTCTKCGHAMTRANYEASLVKMVAKTAGKKVQEGLVLAPGRVNTEKNS